MSTAAQRGWGLPCSQPIVTARWVQPRGTAIAIPVHRDIVRLVMALVNRLGTARGRDIAQYGTWGYACLAGETLVMTPDGNVPIRELAGTTARLLTRKVGVNGARASWVSAPVRSYGQQPLMRVTLSRNGNIREVYATPEHRWYESRSTWAKDGVSDPHRDHEVTTADLRPGARLASCWTHSVAARTVPSPLGVAHGLVTGDGSVMRRYDRDGRGEGVLALYGTKNWPLVRFFPADQRQGFYTDPAHAEGHILVSGLPAAWKRPPSPDESSTYLYGWLAGYFAADGRITANGKQVHIYSVDEALLEAAEMVCRTIGIVTYGIHLNRKAEDHPTQIGAQSIESGRALYELRIDPRSLSADFFVIPAHRERWSGGGKRRPRWKVVSVETTDRVEEVFCAEVSGTECFALADYLLTGNCRYISGTSIWSNHASGLAIDLEAPSNGQGLLGYGSMPRNAGAIASALGFGWGGYVGVGGTYSASYTDPMHFEFLGTPAQAAYLTSQLGTTGGVDMQPGDKVTVGRYAGWTWLQVWDYTASQASGAKSLAELNAKRLSAVEATLTTVKQQTAP